MVIFHYTLEIEQAGPALREEILNTKSPEGLLDKFWCNKLTNPLIKHAIELQHDTVFAELVDALGLRGDLI